jgi:putative phosphoribosyl transferase
MLTDAEKYEHRGIIITGDKLEGDLCIPHGANAIVLFAHGSGSSKYSTRNRYVAQELNNAGFGTLLVDLLTQKEKDIDSNTRHLRFDIMLLASRIESVTNWLIQEPRTQNLSIGYFGSSTGAAAALIHASTSKKIVKAIVSRGGRLDLAEGWIEAVSTPTLLIVGGCDINVIGINKRAINQLTHAEAKELVVIPGAGHLFEETGKIEEVAKAAVNWFESYLLRNGKSFRSRYSHEYERFLSGFTMKQIFQLKFKDRAAAGEMLSELLSKYKNEAPMVIGIARGGIVVADMIARKLSAEFDIVVSRRLRSPINSENPVGAIMQDGSVYLDNSLIQSLNLSNEYLQSEKLEQKKEIDRILALYRPETKQYRIKHKIVILADDGAATGASILVAARWIRKLQPKKLVIAVPVASSQAIRMLQEEADDFEIIRRPSNFESVEQFYLDFSPVPDQRIMQIVRDHFS